MAADVERQYRDGLHIGSGLPRATCPCGFCAKHRHGFNQDDAECAHDYVRCDSVCTECGEKTPHPVPVAGSAGQAPITKEWCMKMATLEPEEGVPSAGLATLDNSTTAIPVSPDELAKLSTAPSLTQGSAGQAPLTDEQRAALKHLVARGSTFPDHNGRGGSTSRVEYAHLQVAAKVLSSILAAPTAPSLATDAGAVLTEGQRSAIESALGLIGLSGDPRVRNIHKTLRAMLDAHPTEQRMSDAARECEWTYDDVDFKWDSACGESWVFNDDGPVENKVRFCHGCGGRVTIAARKAEIERQGGEA